LQKEAVARSAANLKQNRPADRHPVPSRRCKSRDLAGGSSGSAVGTCRTRSCVREHDRKLFDQVFNGAKPLSQARREVHRSLKRDRHRKAAEALPAGFDTAPTSRSSPATA
jgi:hypothetical protein